MKKRTWIRLTSYLLIVAVAFVAINMKKNSIVSDREQEKITFISEKQKLGMPVKSYRVKKDRFPFYVNLSAKPVNSSVLESHVTKGMKEKLKTGQSFEAVIGNKRVKGRIAGVSNAMDLNNGLYGVTLKTNRNQLMNSSQVAFVKVITRTQPNSIFVPNSAIVDEDGKHYIWLVGNSKRIKKANVELGTDNGTHTIIKRGVSTGDMVVTEGKSELVDNAKARVYEEGRQS